MVLTSVLRLRRGQRPVNQPLVVLPNNPISATRSRELPRCRTVRESGGDPRRRAPSPAPRRGFFRISPRRATTCENSTIRPYHNNKTCHITISQQQDMPHHHISQQHKTWHISHHHITMQLKTCHITKSQQQDMPHAQAQQRFDNVHTIDNPTCHNRTASLQKSWLEVQRDGSRTLDVASISSMASLAVSISTSTSLSIASITMPISTMANCASRSTPRSTPAAPG